MKSEKLQNAIGLVDSDLVKRAEMYVPKRKRRKHIKWVVPVAAALAIIIGVGVMFGNGFSFYNNNSLTVPTGSTSSVIPSKESDISDLLLPQSPSIELPPIDTELVSSGEFNIVAAKYPVKTKYPNLPVESGGQSSSDDDKWFEEKSAQRAFFGAGNNLDGFFEKTISEFLSDSGDSNLVYSPLNIYMALAMLAETTDGESRQQILDLLDADSIEALRTQAYAIWNANYTDDGVTTSNLASSLWLGEGLEYNSDVLGILAQYYYASVFQGDMGTSEYNQALKNWLNDQTGGLLEDFVSDVSMSAETLLALATTVYFKAQWSDDFLEENTYKETFHTPSGDIECDFMHRTDISNLYFWGEKFSAVSQSFDESGSMWFILPDEGISVDELLSDEEALDFITTSDKYDYDLENNRLKWKNSGYYKVNLSVPKFDVCSDITLSEGLKNLGVTNCFDPNKADCSPLLGDGNAYISEATHSARVVIDEEGVEAAAITIMYFKGATPDENEEIDFVLDRPFIFVIDNEEGDPLFVGVVNNP